MRGEIYKSIVNGKEVYKRQCEHCGEGYIIDAFGFSLEKHVCLNKKVDNIIDNIREELKELNKDQTIETLELLKEQIELRVKQLKS